MTDRDVPQMVSGTSISLKYAHIERERRFLFQGSIPSFSHVRSLQIRDCYLLGTTLRLRRVDEFGLPLGLVNEVINDERFTGGALAKMTAKELNSILNPELI